MSNRFFVQGVHERGERVGIDAADAHHIVDVLRLRAGDCIEIIDSSARSFVGRLERVRDGLVAELVSECEAAAGKRLTVEVAQALPKGAKFDLVVEKATELGAAIIRPFTSERTIARGAGAQKVARWRRIARSAAEQCGRREMPTIADPVSYAELAGRFREYGAVLFAWESADRTPLRERLPALIASARSVLLVIGPEGGFSHAEAAAARTNGAHLVSLGPHILRTETAALALLAVVAYESDEQPE